MSGKSLNKTLLCVVACAIICLGGGCSEKQETIALAGNVDSLPTETAHEITVLYNDSSYTRARIRAKEMRNYGMQARPYMDMPKGLQMEFYNERHEVTSTLRADYAIRYELEKLMEAQRNVVVVNEKGDKLETERLVWDANKQMFWSDRYVKITTAEEIIEGTGLEANEDFSRYTVKNIKGILSVEK